MNQDAVAPSAPRPPWNWKDLHRGTASWRAAFTDLAEWVLWYTETYELWQSMPVCWYEHSRLVEELRALRFHHHAVCTAGTDAAAPSARDYADWMSDRRDWEQTVLGLAPRGHGGCSGLTHEPSAAATEKGHRDRLTRMAAGLLQMLDTTVPGGEGSG